MRRFRTFTLDEARHELQRDGRDVHLTPKAFELLVLLIDAAPRVMRKTELLDRLWPNGVVSDASLVGLVGEIRRALADDDAGARIIRNVPRVGYAFNAAVEAGLAHAGITRWLVWRERRISLEVGENLIGRDPESRLWLDYSTVSRRHARVVVSEAGAVIEDLGSKNGTRIGDSRVTQPTRLSDGDSIGVGRMTVTYRESIAGLSTATQLSRVEEFPAQR